MPPTFSSFSVAFLPGGVAPDELRICPPAISVLPLEHLTGRAISTVHPPCPSNGSVVGGRVVLPRAEQHVSHLELLPSYHSIEVWSLAPLAKWAPPACSFVISSRYLAPLRASASPPSSSVISRAPRTACWTKRAGIMSEKCRAAQMHSRQPCARAQRGATVRELEHDSMGCGGVRLRAEPEAGGRSNIYSGEDEGGDSEQCPACRALTSEL